MRNCVGTATDSSESIIILCPKHGMGPRCDSLINKPQITWTNYVESIWCVNLLPEIFVLIPWGSMTYLYMGPINDIPALVQILAWRRPGDKPLSEPMMVILLMQ